MNLFTTDHPLASPTWHPETWRSVAASRLGSVLVVGLILYPVFLGVAWFATIGADSPDMAEPDFVDLCFGMLGLLVFFPAFLLAPMFGEFFIRVGITEESFRSWGLGFNSLFWGFVLVSGHALLTRRRRSARDVRGNRL